MTYSPFIVPDSVSDGLRMAEETRYKLALEIRALEIRANAVELLLKAVLRQSGGMVSIPRAVIRECVEGEFGLTYQSTPEEVVVVLGDEDEG